MSPSSWLLYIYTFSVLCAIILLIILPTKRYSLVSDISYVIPAFILFVFILAFLLPFTTFNEHNVKILRLPSWKIMNIFSNIIIFLSLYSIYFYSFAVREIFTLDLSEARDSRYGMDAEEFFEVGFENTVASVSASFYVFAIMLFFIYLIKGKSKWRCLLLFLSSFSEAIHVLAFVGRDGVVFWIFTFIFEYFFFKDYLSSSMQKKVRNFSIITISIILIPFIIITQGRFEGKEYIAMLDYMGQPFINGTLFFGMEEQPRNYGYNFPLFWELIGSTSPSKKIWSGGGTDSKYFMTFVYGMVLSLGYLGTIIICLISRLIIKRTFSNVNEIFPLYKFFIYLMYFQVFSEGVFYFRHHTRGGNLYILLSFVFAFVFYQFQLHSNNIVYKKNEKF